MFEVEKFDKSRKRLEALWDGEIIDRCCISAFAIDDETNAEFYTPPQDDMDRKYFLTDPEMIRKRHLRFFEKAYYAGDAFPLINLNMGPSGHTGFIRGVKVDYTDTIWYHPIMEDGLDPEKIVLDEESYLYRQTFEASKYLCEESRGDYLVSMPDISGNMDVLANLRSSTELLVDLITEEEEVKECLERIQEIWEKSTSRIYEYLKPYNFGGSCIGWLNSWAPGFHNQMQCDMSVMFSNEYYEKYIRKELETQSAFVDYPLYHFDGVEQIRHLDTLLSIDRLKMIQWTNVVGQPSPVQYIPVFQRIQEAGKGLLLLLGPGEVRPILENLSSRGLFINVKVKSKDEADEMVKLAWELTKE
ncbi:MAG: hypothetical protein ACOX8E_07935 [Ruminococcus sp.]|jgi:hypothetical protein